MHSRFIEEKKPGVTMRTGDELLDVVQRRTSHDNILSQHGGNSHGDDRQSDAYRGSVVFRQQLPRQDIPYPVPPQVWHFRQSIEYSITANRAILDVASRNRERYLYNMYVKGKN